MAQVRAYGARPSCRALPSRSLDNAATTSPLTTPQPQTAMPPSGSSHPLQQLQPHAYADHWKLVGPSDAGLQPSQHLESYSPQLRNPFRFNKAVNRSNARLTPAAPPSAIHPRTSRGPPAD